MKKIFGYILAVACMGMLCAPTAMAKPAKRTPYTLSNPDGSTVVLTKVGDEFFHCYLTEDGYPVQQDADGWYRIIDNLGAMTEVIARNLSERDAKATEAMNAIMPRIAYDAAQHKGLGNSRMYQTRAYTPQMQRMGKAPQRVADNSDGHNIATFPCQGEQKVLAIMVNYADKKFSFCQNPGDELRSMLHDPGYSNFGATGSAFDFYVASSNGIFRPSFDVYGPVELDHPYSYYGQNDSSGNDMRPGAMVKEACEKLDGIVDFSEYDRDGDGYVDNIYIFYAGHGEADYNDRNTIWPHSWDLKSATGACPELDGVKLNHYACSAELNGYDDFDGIGTFCHEFAHVLGLPDLYTTDYGAAYDLTPGAFSALDYGPYNNDGKTPPIFSSYEQYALDWIEPVLIDCSREVVLPPLTRANLAYKVKSNNFETEYFLLENRQQESWDGYIPAPGMLVWHIDFKKSAWDSNTVNNNPAHQHVDIMESDGKAGRDKGTDPFPGVAESFDFSATSSPAKFVNWSSRSPGYSLSTIEQNSDGTVSFKILKDGDNGDLVTHQAPVVHYDNLSDDGFTAMWQPVDGAVDYMLTVYPLEDGLMPMEPVKVNEVVGNYLVQRMGDETSVELTGLEPGVVYYVGVNALYKDGMSRPATLYVMIPDGSTEDSPAIFAKKIDGTDVTLAWAGMEDADSYDLTVAKRTEATDIEIETYGFDNRLPAGWDYIAAFTEADGTYGKAAPAVKFSHQADFLQSDIYDMDINKLKFWSKFSIDDPRARVEIYGTYPDGSMVLVDKIEATNTAAKTYEVEFPAGVRQFAMYYYYSKKGQTMYVDDFEVTLAGGYTDTPIEGYAARNLSATEHKVSGLEPETEYVAYVQANKGGLKTEVSKAVKFVTGNASGISAFTTKSTNFAVRNGVVIPGNSTEAYDLYSIDGTLLARGLRGNYHLPAHGLYIARTANTAQKLAW